jgi:ribosomal protein L11 methyltransferase
MRELVLLCPGALAEPLSDALLECGALSVSVEDADSDTDDEQPLFGEPGSEPNAQAWSRNRVIVLLADGTDPEQLLAAARLDLDNTSELSWHLRQVPDADWVRLTQSQFGPITVGHKILIVPSWHADQMPVAPEPRRIAIQLDPGLAFGTGSHPTTHLCLEWLADELPKGATVLDYGCGSGILAIGAAMLGAASVSAVDIDPDAVIAAQANAVANHVELNLGLPDTAWGQYPMVVANILAAPLKVLAPLLCSHLAAGGTLLLAGILDRQTEDIQAAYQPYLDLQVADTQEGWVLMRGQAV